MQLQLSEEKLKSAGLNPEERAIVLNMATASADIFSHALPVEKMTEAELWERKLDFYQGYIDGMTDALTIILKVLRKRSQK